MKTKFNNPNDDWYYSQRYDKKASRGIKGCFISIIGILIIAVVALLLSGCKSTQYVPVETVIHDSIFTEKIVIKTDTTKEKVLVKDSSWMSIHEADSAELAALGIRLKGINSAYIVEYNKVKQLQNQLESLKENVVIKDSIVYKDREVQVPYPVEKQISTWERMKYGLMGVLIILGFVVVFTIILKVVSILKK